MKILFFLLLMWTFHLCTNGKKTMREEYDARKLDKKNTKKWSEKGVVKAIGEVKRIGNSKIVSVTCRLDAKKFGMVQHIMWWVMWWRPKISKKHGLIAGSFLNDMPVMGRNNLRWEKRKSLVNNLKPHLVCAVENQNSESYMKQNNTGDYLRMYLIMDKCDPPGVFRCEALIKAFNNPGHEVPIHGEFDAEETKEGKVASTCKKDQFKDLARNYLDIYDSLPSFYMESMRNAFLKPDEEKGDPVNWPAEGGYTTMDAHFNEEKSMKYMELTCKVNIRKIKQTVNSVEAFYIFYQPDEHWPNARVLLAGLVRSKGMWADPYRVRMFPELRALLDKHKGMSWRGNTGTGKKATFTITIPLKLCQILKGAFQCQAAVEAPNLSSKKTTMIRGWFKLRDTPFSTGSKKCRLEKLKSSGNKTRSSGGRAVIRLVKDEEKEGSSGAGAIVGVICGIIALGVAGFIGYKLYLKKTQSAEKAEGVGGQGVKPPGAKGPGKGRGRGRAKR